MKMKILGDERKVTLQREEQKRFGEATNQREKDLQSVTRNEKVDKRSMNPWK